MHGWVAERMVRCAEKMVGSDLPPKYGRSGSPHNTSNNTCAPSQLPYMVWLVGWLGGRPIRPGFGIGVAISQVKKPLALNLTGLAALSDRGAAALLPLTALRRLSLCATGIGDAALDYLTYYQRYAMASSDGRTAAIRQAPPQQLVAAKNNDAQLLEEILSQPGADANAANGIGQNALHVAALWGLGFVRGWRRRRGER